MANEHDMILRILAEAHGRMHQNDSARPEYIP